LPDRSAAGNRAGPAAWRFIAPFAAWLGLIAASQYLGLDPRAAYPARVLAAALLLLAFSRRLIPWRPRRPGFSILVGAAVFVIWILPELLWPAYRQSWLFNNPLAGGALSALPPESRAGPLFLVFRVAGSALVVPVAEELFWRGWLMRWLISREFAAVPLGAYARSAFWISAALFASEHGPYWDVGLAAGVAYNWWVVRTRNLADCILAHAVTNGCLAAYVLLAGAWQYWL
jgi:CAAX prenyl protease-like protein